MASHHRPDHLRQQQGAGAGAGQSPPPPLVLFLDLDGTIVGDVSHLVTEREVVRTFAGDAPAKVKAMRASHVARLRYGIIRPKFDAFLRRVEACNRDPSGRRIELFVYTASDDAWAAYLVGCIEGAVGFRFNRPIFSRRHCKEAADGSISKALSPLLPAVVAGLRRKGFRTLTVAALEAQSRVAFVDNTPSVLRDPRDRAKLIPCRTYDFSAAFDVLGLLDVDAVQAHYVAISRFLEARGMYPSDGGPPLTCRHFFHAYLASLTSRMRRATRMENSAQLRDRFWVRLRSALTSPSLVSRFDPRHVDAISRHVAAEGPGQ